MADTIDSVVKIGLLGVAAWWIYDTFFSTAAAATTATTSTTSGTGTTSTTVTTPTTITSGTTTPIPVTVAAPAGADAAYTSLVAAMTAATHDPAVVLRGGVISALPNVFNAYLATVLPNIAGSVPAPNLVWPSGDPTVAMTSAQYWAGMAPYLSGKGLMGLGHFGAVAQAYRRTGLRLPMYLLQPRVSANYVRVA